MVGEPGGPEFAGIQIWMASILVAAVRFELIELFFAWKKHCPKE